ncbi:hypothetical protein [Pantoea sp. 18069]|uniref:DUF7673 family protein n=1 Tax=Pantoea sp. 18069 TaxID=2681415 RepID=UPI001359D307|nr:hypothetical protein [Pantoea sp. 18069]
MAALASAPAPTPARDPLHILVHFFILADGHSHSTAHVAAQLLLGLYSGSRFPFDLTELRRLDTKDLDMALQLLRFDARPQDEVHELLNQLYGRHDFGMRFEHLAHNWRMKCKCKRDALAPVERIALADPI